MAMGVPLVLIHWDFPWNQVLGPLGRAAAAWRAISAGHATDQLRRLQRESGQVHVEVPEFLGQRRRSSLTLLADVWKNKSWRIMGIFCWCATLDISAIKVERFDFYRIMGEHVGVSSMVGKNATWGFLAIECCGGMDFSGDIWLDFAIFSPTYDLWWS